MIFNEKCKTDTPNCRGAIFCALNTVTNSIIVGEFRAEDIPPLQYREAVFNEIDKIIYLLKRK